MEDLDFRFQTWESGSREEISHRFRIWSQKTWFFASRGQKLGKSIRKKSKKCFLCVCLFFLFFALQTRDSVQSMARASVSPLWSHLVRRTENYLIIIINDNNYLGIATHTHTHTLSVSLSLVVLFRKSYVAFVFWWTREAKASLLANAANE